MTIQIIAYTIISLGLVNVFRMAIFFIAGDWYDIIHDRKEKKQRQKYYHPLVSIIVPAYNEEATIYQCLEGIYTSTYTKFEVIVINDGSRDNTSNIVRRFVEENNISNLTLVEQDNKGKANALNHGITSYSKGSLIMSLDADSIIEKNALLNTVNHFKDKNVVAVASNVRILSDGSFLGMIQTVEYLLGHRLKKALTTLNIEYIIGGIGSTFRRRVLRNCRYYDTDTVTEDIDLTMKIVGKGNKKNRVIFASDVLCYTQAVPSMKSLFRQRFRWKYGRFQTFWKNKEIFFNRNRKYNRVLTFFYLPFALYSEFTFLFDPIFIAFIIFLSIKFLDMTSIIGMFAFLFFYSFICIAFDEYLSFSEKLILLFFSPIAYILFLVISLVEYIALIKCILDYNGIFKVKESGKCNWEHVERSEGLQISAH